MTSAANTTLIFEGVHFAPYDGQRRFRIVMEPGQDWRFESAGLVYDHWFQWTRTSPSCTDLLEDKGSPRADRHINTVSKAVEALQPELRRLRVQAKLFHTLPCDPAIEHLMLSGGKYSSPHLNIVRVN